MKFIITCLICTLLPLILIAEEEHHGHQHHLALFGGATTNFDASHTSPAFGIDYNYYFSDTEPSLGIGLLGELVAAEHQEIIIAIPIAMKFEMGLKAFIAPGVIMAKEIEAVDGEEAKEEMKSHILFRIGTSYDFHYKNISYGPAISGDIYENTFALVYGINIGIGF